MSVLGTIQRGVDICMTRLSYTQNNDLANVVGTIVTKAGTVTGTAGIGSSLFLERIVVPHVMSLSEIQAAMSIGFPATNQGAGTMSRSFGLFSFGNSTSLSTVATASGTSSWQTGTSTSGAVVSLTQFQGGWSSPLIQPMTFASSTIAPGEYVVGQIFDFAQASSTWTIAFYGQEGATTALAQAATNLTSATLGALSSGGLVAGSVATATASIGALSGGGVIAGSVFTASTSRQVVVFTAAPPTILLGKVGSTASLSAAPASSIMATATAASTIALHLDQATQANSFMSSGGLLAGSFLTGSTIASAMSSGGLSAGSFVATSGSVNAVTNVALGALNSTTLAQLTLPNFGFIGTNSTTSGFPTAFSNGIMSTGAIPANITLTSTAVTYSGSIAFQQPWFALVGQ